MRRLLIVFLSLTAIAALPVAFVASPFVAAWSLREAIRTRDIETVERKVEWDRVRASLKRSLAGNAQLLPEATAGGEAVRPSLWQRVKGMFGATMLDRFVENYVTPEGLAQLMSYRKTWRETVNREPAVDSLALHTRLIAFAKRVKRAEFQGFGRIVMEVEDHDTPDRRIRSVFELIGFEWKLAELEILTPGREGLPQRLVSAATARVR